MRIIDPFDQEELKPQGIVDPFDTQEAPKLQGIVDPFDTQEAAAPEEESGFLRQVADVPVGIAKGAATGVRMVADFFGAGSAASETIKGVEDYLGGLLSAQAKRDQQEVARIMKEAEDKGVADQVIAGIKAFSVAPIDTLSQALGTAAPAIVAGLATTLTGGAPLAVAGVTAGVGAAMGAGTIKGTVYEATKEALIEAGTPPEIAEKAAIDAQSYGGENLDQILLGAGIGAVAARTGIEKAILGKVAAREAAKQGIAKATVAEAAPEAAQAAQEQFAENIALQREGFDVPLQRGLVSSATLEAIAGGGLGAGVEVATRGIKTEGPRTKEDEQIDALRNLQPEDMGEVVTPEEARGADTGEVRDDAGRGEPSVSVPAGDIAPAAGVVEPEAGGVGGPSPDVVETPAGEGAVDTALEQQIVDPFAETPAPVAETIAETPAPTPEEKPEPSLSLTSSASLGLTDLMRQEDPKLQAKFEEIRTGKKKVFKEYAPVVEDMQRTVDELSEFIRQQGVDPTDLASLRGASPEVQGAARLLSALGQDANNLTLAVKNQEVNYARAKTPEAKAEVTDAVPKRKLADAQETIRLAREFIADPSKGTGDIVFSGVREVPPGTRGSEARLVREAVGQVVADWENAPRVEVVQSISELPAYMRDQIARDKVNPQGAYDPVSNLVFLVGDNLRGREDVFTTIAHEALGHFGLRSILGDSYKRVMNEIYNGHKEVKTAADKKMEDSPNMSREIAVEEVLAEMAETSPKPTPALRRLFDAIRRFARRIGIPLKSVTDGELQQLVANASRYVRRNELKFDRFTEGQVQPGGPRAVTGDKAVFGGAGAGSIGYHAGDLLYARDTTLGRIAGGRSTGHFGTGVYFTSSPEKSLAGREGRPVYPVDLNKFNLLKLRFNVEAQELHDGLKDVNQLAEYGLTDLDKELPREFLQNAVTVRERLNKAVEKITRGLDGAHTEKEVREAVTKAIESASKDLPRYMFQNDYVDSASTRVMKELGYDGIDTRGLSDFDNVEYGTVVYRKELKSSQAGELNPAAKNLQAVYSQKFKSEAGPARINPGNAPGFIEKLIDGRPKWPEVKGAFNLKSIPSLPPTAKQGMYKLMTLRMLKDVAGKRVPEMGKAITVSEQMVAERGRIMRDGADILDKVQVLRKQKNGDKQVKLLGELAVQATMLEIDPDPNSKFHKPNKTLTDAWNTLTPEAQQIYKEMRGFYENQVDGMVSDMKARIDRNFPKDSNGKENPKAIKLKKEIDEEFGPAKRKGPYFPLRRFGQYWFQVGKAEDKEFYMFESVGDRDFWMAERQKELIAEGRQDLADSINSGDSIREGANSLNNSLASEPIMKKIEKMVDDASKALADPTKKARAVDDLKDGIKQLQYLLLPSTNLRKAFIHRKGIAGASPDLVRVFSTSAVNLAYQRARVKYSEQFYDNIENGFGFLENAPNNAETRATRDLLNELDSRAGHILGMEPSGASEKVANGITQFSFLWLLTAPASAMVNVFGAGAVAMPYIGARYGYDKAMARIADYAAKYVATAPKVRKGNTVFPTLDKSTKLDPIQDAAYRQFLHDNTIDVSLTQDIMGLGQAPFEEYSLSQNKLVRGVSALFHHSERMSREIMNMAAFDLAYADNVKKGMAPGVDGQAFKEAIETAKDLTMMSIGDFTRASKPPILTGPLTRIVFQFKQYSLLMTYNLLRNTMLGFNPMRANLTEDQKAEAKEARRRMYGVVGMTALFAGLKGVPIFTATSMMAEVINSIFGDDEEEEFIFEYWLQQYLTDTVGGDAAAALMTGLISNATNTALSERMSLDLVDLWFRDGMYQKSAEDTMKEQFLALLGPSVSIAMSVGKAKDLLDNYQPERALEAMSPTILRNLQIVGRYVREGEAATARGITIDEDISYSDLFVRALGFTPEDIMRKQKAMIDRKGVEMKIETRRERLLAGLYMSLHYGDDDLYEATMEKILEFNEAFPEVAIETDTINSSLERKLKDKAKQEALGGVSEKLYGRIEEAVPTRD